MYSWRQARQDLNTKLERDISECINQIEELGADILLTDTVILLGQAKEKLGEYLDKQFKDVVKKDNKNG